MSRRTAISGLLLITICVFFVRTPRHAGAIDPAPAQEQGSASLLVEFTRESIEGVKGFDLAFTVVGRLGVNGDLEFVSLQYKKNPSAAISDTELGSTFIAEVLKRSSEPGATLTVGDTIPVLSLASSLPRVVAIPDASSVEARRLTRCGAKGNKNGFAVTVHWSLSKVSNGTVDVTSCARGALTRDLLDKMKDPTKRDAVIAQLGGLKATSGKLASGSLTVYMAGGEYKLVLRQVNELGFR